MLSTVIRRITSVEWMFLGLWIIGYAAYMTQPMSDPDTPWHLATGFYILSHHVVPKTDPFSWTMFGKPWVTQEWLFEAVIGWMAKHFAFVGVWFTVFIIHTLTVITLYRIGVLVSDGNRTISALLASAATLSAILFWTIRPQSVSYLMFAVFLWILQSMRAGRMWAAWLAIPLMVVWANAHGSSIIGVLMLLFEVAVSFIPSFGRIAGLDLPSGARPRLLAAAVLGFAAGLLNPNGLKAYTYALLSTDATMTKNIVEWHSPDFQLHYYEYGVLPMLAVAFLILLASWSELPLREMLYFGGLLVLTLIHQRFMPYLGIALVPLFAYVMQDWVWSLNSPSFLMRFVDLLMVVSALGVFVWAAPKLKGPLDKHFSVLAYPVYAVNYIEKHHITGRILNAYEYGGYFIYRGIPTFVDGRTDIYLKSSVFVDYLAIKNVWPNVQSLLNHYRFQAAVLPGNAPITAYLQNQTDWRTVYRDLTTVVLIHDAAR